MNWLESLNYNFSKVIAANVFKQGNCEDKFRDSINKIFLYPDTYLEYYSPKFLVAPLLPHCHKHEFIKHITN